MELNQDMSVRGWCFWKIAVDNGILNTFHVITAILKSEIKRKQKQLRGGFNHLHTHTHRTPQISLYFFNILLLRPHQTKHCTHRICRLFVELFYGCCWEATLLLLWWENDRKELCWGGGGGGGGGGVVFLFLTVLWHGRLQVSCLPSARPPVKRLPKEPGY